jgi:hypothetical protein
MTETAVSLSGNPDSTDGLVRELEESGYPVDGATEQFVPQPEGVAAEPERTESRAATTKRSGEK